MGVSGRERDRQCMHVCVEGTKRQMVEEGDRHRDREGEETKRRAKLGACDLKISRREAASGGDKEGEGERLRGTRSLG